MRPTRAYINLTKLRDNIIALKGLIGSYEPRPQLMAVVKANAYGHGAIKISQHAIQAGAEWLAVAIPEEGIELRHAGINVPILVLGPIVPDQIDKMLDHNLIPTVFTEDIAKVLNNIGKVRNQKVPIHIKVDSGMGRIGVQDTSKLRTLLGIIMDLPYIHCQGIYTHFATSDEDDESFMNEQLKRFQDMLLTCEDYGIDFDYVHAANSAAILRAPSTYFDLVRAGIAMYGYGSGIEKSRGQIDLYPILEWHTKIVHIKDVAPNTSIGYGGTFKTDRRSIIATLPLGYADGYNRLLSNRGYVLIRGMRAPIVGRICMDQTMVDITDIKGAKIGDDVVLMGSQGQETVTAEDIALLCNTISHEVLTSISHRVERIYI
ncbi:MAG: alanine racemase [Clostridiales bacterium]|nr:alanine racemase [Clostridiales bacterium]